MRETPNFVAQAVQLPLVARKYGGHISIAELTVIT